MRYKARLVDSQLQDLLEITGFVVIEGPKAVGKTETAKQVAGSIVQLDIESELRELARVAPMALLNGNTPRLIDEWQLIPELWSFIKAEVDSRQLRGQFILTGSSVPSDEVTRDSGAGRLARIKMRPMSLYESGESEGSISLKELFSQQFEAALGPDIKIHEIAGLICKGGWPSNQDLTVDQARKLTKSYVEELASIDLQRVSGIKYNKARVLKVLMSLARNVGTKASDTLIAADTGDEGNPMDRKIVTGYLETLTRVMITENNPSWTPSLRSRDRVNGSSTRYFIDPSIATAVLNVSPKSLLGGEIKFLGFLFENLAIRDLRVYMQSLNGSVKQYRDDSGLEVDAILEMEDNVWAAIEIKLGTNYVDQGAENLLKFKSKINIDICGEPAFMAVLTATGPNYLRKDGIYVLSIASLRP